VTIASRKLAAHLRRTYAEQGVAVTISKTVHRRLVHYLDPKGRKGRHTGLGALADAIFAEWLDKHEIAK